MSLKEEGNEGNTIRAMSNTIIISQKLRNFALPPGVELKVRFFFMFDRFK